MTDRQINALVLGTFSRPPSPQLHGRAGELGEVRLVVVIALGLRCGGWTWDGSWELG